MRIVLYISKVLLLSVFILSMSFLPKALNISTELALTFSSAFLMALVVSSMQRLFSGFVTFWLEEDFAEVFFEELDLAVVLEDELVFFVADDEVAFFSDEDDNSFRMSSRSSRVNEELLSTEISSSSGIEMVCLSLEHPAIKKEIEKAAAKKTLLTFIKILLG